jgi:ATP-dependent DNA ligase
MEFPKLRGSVSLVTYPCFAEVKLDGEATMFVKNGNESKLVNRRGRKIENEKVKEWCHQSFEDIEYIVLFGESYVNEGKKGDLYELLKAKDKDLKFMPIDILSINLQLPNEQLKVRREMIEHRMGRIVPGHDIADKTGLNAYNKNALALGYEGIVVKPLHCFLHGINPCVKIKETDTSVFPISKIEKAADRIEVMVDTIKGPKAVGVKATSKQKAKLKLGTMVTIEHKGILSEGGLRHPVLVGIAKEVVNV